ncbi:MAG: L-selectin [Bacteroides sp.]|nr:L-selectin [Bacteroides sp.]MBQ8224816.1 L-selectin [Bacteroides sp.]
MDEKIKFQPNVLLIDVTFINEIAATSRKVLGERLGRELPELDLPTWLTYLALDAGLRGADNEVQVLLVHEADTHRLNGCQPNDLPSLNGMACRTPLGEFQFSCVTPADIATREELFLDLMTLAQDSADVQCLALLPFHPEYGQKMERELTKLLEEKDAEECRKVFYFALSQPSQEWKFRTDFVTFSLLKAFGVGAEEMK